MCHCTNVCLLVHAHSTLTKCSVNTLKTFNVLSSFGALAIYFLKSCVSIFQCLKKAVSMF